MIEPASMPEPQVTGTGRGTGSRALGTGHKGQDLGVLAELLGVELVTV